VYKNYLYLPKIRLSVKNLQFFALSAWNLVKMISFWIGSVFLVSAWLVKIVDFLLITYFWDCWIIFVRSLHYNRKQTIAISFGPTNIVGIKCFIVFYTISKILLFNHTADFYTKYYFSKSKHQILAPFLTSYFGIWSLH
jgi:hypothetical protein